MAGRLMRDTFDLYPFDPRLLMVSRRTSGWSGGLPVIVGGALSRSPSGRP